MTLYLPIDVDAVEHFRDEPKLRMGVFVLSSDQGIEDELTSLLPKWTKANFVRMPSYVTCSERGNSHQAELIETAKRLEVCLQLQTIIYGCTSGELLFGKPYIESALKTIFPNLHVVTPINATISAIRELSIDSISILTPYDQSLNRKLADKLESEGISVANVYEFSLVEDAASSKLNRRFFLDAADHIAGDGSQALFVPCNSLSIVNFISSMENHLNAPVLTSTQVSVWKAIHQHRIQIPKVPKKFGKIFENLAQCP